MKFYIIIVFLALFLVVDARIHQEEKNPNLTVLEKHFKVGDGDVEGFFGDMQGALIDCFLKDASACCAQHQADKLVDVAYYLGDIKKEDKKKALIDLTISLLLSEKNTPINGQPAEVCKQPPRHKELNGVAERMAQDPASKTHKPKLDPYKPTNKDPKNFVLKLGRKIIAPNCRKFPPKDPKDICTTRR